MLIARERALKQYGRADFAETIYFGDEVWDFNASKSLNWRMIGIGKKIDSLKYCGVERVFPNYSSPSELFEIIEV